MSTHCLSRKLDAIGITRKDKVPAICVGQLGFYIIVLLNGDNQQWKDLFC